MELPAPDVEGYKGGNVNACYDQLVAFIMANPPEEGDDDSDVARAFAFEIAAKVGFQYCTHDSAPEPLQDMGLQNRKHAASAHPGLCGYYHAGVIAAVKTEDVQAKWGSTTGNKFRNQVRKAHVTLFLLFLLKFPNPL